MNLFRLAALAALIAAFAVQADEADKQVEMKVVVAAGDGHDTVTFNSATAGFEPSDLAVGETRSIPNVAGKDVTMTRTEDGLQISVDGEVIDLPHIEAHGAYMMVGDDIDFDFEHHGGVAEAVDVQVVGAHAIRAHGPEGVTIISGTALDDSVRESIRSVLISAGIDEEVTFIDSSEQDRHVRVIRRVEQL